MTNEEALKIINEYGLSSRGYPNLKEAISIAISALESQRWIPVTERLPETVERALVIRHDYVSGEYFIDLLWYEQGCWWNRMFGGNYAVTHWMPLPPMPKEEIT